ncbi:hypothetical protein BO94DRAFT_226809 [Aspergillus sclerotioniger CBS 115572]|uniref:BTB domain-containing protein n=1 Tax=Aspergillus sclerotioniger CBS 115572 TaxID=1450535 RepID=A0A317XCU6_9EURO|nr:hypothetical protein BO94DRAFT_226809 [Aspergillus sclerotioniger CBS 115572]PWY95407.1 hypothetical protein BO94DRAFT_226809 [Aspergillus sclerotioniger CBS 115572]
MGQKNYKRLYYNLLRSQDNEEHTQEHPITEYPQPEISSYTTPIVTIIIGKSRFQVAEYHLRPYSSLELHSSELRINDINEDIGHTFVHFLSTGAYETLKPTDLDPESCPWAREFERSVHAYHAARRYNIFGLEEHAKRYMVTFSEEVSTRQLLKTVSKVYSELPGHDSWFEGFVRDKLTSAFTKDEYSFRYRVVRDGLGSDDDFNRFLMYTTLEIYAEKLASLREVPAPGPQLNGHQPNGHADIHFDKGSVVEQQRDDSHGEKEDSSQPYPDAPLSADDTPTVVNAGHSRPGSPVPPSSAFLDSPAQNGFNWAESCSDSAPIDFPTFAPSPPLVRRPSTAWADPEPEREADPEPELKPEAKPEPELQLQPELEPVPELKPEPVKPEPVPESESALKSELVLPEPVLPEPVKSEPVFKSEPEPILKPTPESVFKPAEPEPMGIPKSVVNLPKPEPSFGMFGKSVPANLPKSEPVPKSEPADAPPEQPQAPKKKNKPNSHRRKRKAQALAAAAQNSGVLVNDSAAKPSH